MRDFEGKVIVVTGAGGGVGTALCRQFAERGGTIIAVGRTAAKLESTLAIVRGLGSQILMITGDITRAETAARVADACASLGGVDVLINNAAVGYSYEKMHPGSMARLGDQTPDLWRDVVDINLTGPAAITQALLPKLLERREGANVVFISSILSLRGHSNAHAYSAA
ncbi:MAG: SDR family oxidoreductase, partial [Sphingobium sp.]